MGKVQGILGMDWLSMNQDDIHCKQRIVSFLSSSGEKVQIQGRAGKAPLKVVKINRLVKGLRKGLPIYVLNLNKPEKEPER